MKIAAGVIEGSDDESCANLSDGGRRVFAAVPSFDPLTLTTKAFYCSAKYRVELWSRLSHGQSNITNCSSSNIEIRLI